jgi:hypothetical protein
MGENAIKVIDSAIILNLAMHSVKKGFVAKNLAILQNQ